MLVYRKSDLPTAVACISNEVAGLLRPLLETLEDRYDILPVARMGNIRATMCLDEIMERVDSVVTGGNRGHLCGVPCEA